MKFKKIGKSLLFPHISVALPLVPICAVWLGYAMLSLEDADPVRLGAYVLSFYTLIVWCARVPKIVRFAKKFKKENRYVNRWLADARLRVNVILSGNAVWNIAYAALQLGLGVYHGSAWFCSLAVYYASLAFMRFFLVRYTMRYKPGEKMRDEWRRYGICGRVFLVLNTVLTVMIFYMVYRNQSVSHHEITTIAMATYTFISLTMAIVNVIKYRKYRSPVFSASKAISLASACVSMLTLEGTMLTTFGGADMTVKTRRLFLGLSGAAVSAFILVMAIGLIARGNKQIKKTEN